MPCKAVLLLLLLYASCSRGKYETIEGDLYFQSFDFFRIFDAPDSVLSRIEAYALHANPDTIKEKNRASYEMVKHAIDCGLLRKPYIRIRMNRNEEVMLFMSRKDFRQFAGLKCGDLKKQQKIRITARAENVSYREIRAYNTIELLQVERTGGETICRK